MTGHEVGRTRDDQPPRSSLRRDDLAASVALYQAATRSPRLVLPGLAFVGGLALGPILGLVATYFGLPEASRFVALVVGWVLAVTAMVVYTRRHGALLARHQWRCPSCQAPMIASRGLKPLARAETAIASGRCPACGETLFPDR